MLRIGRTRSILKTTCCRYSTSTRPFRPSPIQAQPYFLRAIAKLNLEDYRGAEADATKAIELNPYLTDAWEVRGVARQNTGRHRLAIDDYSEALKLLPRNRQLLFNRALALNDLKEYTEAIAAFDEIIRHYPGFDNAYIRVAPRHG